MSEKMLKRSYHVVVRGIVYEGGNTSANFLSFVHNVTPLFELNTETAWGPRVRVGGPDEAVYTKNRNMRAWGCSKLGQSSDPDAMKRFDKILTDTLDPLHTLVCYIDQDGLLLLVPPALSTAVTKRRRTADGEPTSREPKHRVSSHAQSAAFDELVMTRRPNLVAMRAACQKIMLLHGDTSTTVLDLKDVNWEKNSLRFETRNGACRKCLAGAFDHDGNNALLWLEPTVFGKGLDLSQDYRMLCMCMAPSCGKATVLLGSLVSDGGTDYYPVVTNPPVLMPAKKRPQGFVPRWPAAQAAAPLPQVPQLPQAQLSQAQLPQAQLPQAQLSQAQLSQAQLPQAQLSQVQLSQAQLSQAQLPQMEAVKGHVDSLKSYNPRVGVILAHIAAADPALYIEYRNLWLKHSAYFGYPCSDTQMVVWNSIQNSAPDVAELGELSSADNPPKGDKALNTYGFVKRVVMSEYGLMKFEENVGYAKRKRSNIDDSMMNTLEYLPKEKLSTLLAEKFYHDRAVADDGSVSYKRRRFVDKWIEDDEKKSYNGVDVDPSGGKRLSSRTFNLWGGFDVQKIPRDISATVGERSDRIRRHICEELASGITELYDFILDLVAHYLYRPDVRTNVLMFIYGLQGAGKSWFTDLLKALMGIAAYGETDSPENHLFGKHGHLWLGRIVIHIAEAKNLRDLHKNLKNIVTAVTMTYEQKFQDLKEARNYSNIIVTANIMSAVYVPHDDRRVCAMKVSSKRIGNKEYFDRLFADISDPATLRDFYDYLGTRDLSCYGHGGMQFAVPRTAFWHECVRMGASSIHTFLSAFVNKHIDGPSAVIQVLASTFRSDLHSFQSTRGGKLTPDNQIPSRINDLGENHGFSHKTTRGVAKYEFDLPKMKAFLIKMNLFDEDATY
jgi:hypothetical protein